jgi:hypothetical protein
MQSKLIKTRSLHPSDKTIAWLEKNVGPRTHYTKYNIGGKGWRFICEQDNPWSAKHWYLTIDDEKMRMFYLLSRTNIED